MVQINGEEVHRLNCYDNKYYLSFSTYSSYKVNKIRVI